MKLARIAAVAGAVALVAIGLAACTPSAPAETKKVLFATDSTWPPMEFIDDNKELVGFDIDLVKAVAEAAGFTAEFQSVGWDGIFAGLENGQYGAIVSSVTITDERKEKYDFSSPYVNAGQVLLVPVADSATTSLADLAGKSVGTQIGTTGSLEVQKNPAISLKEYEQVGLAIGDLVNGNVAGVVIDSPVAADFALQNKDFKDKVKIVGEPMTSEELGIVVKKGDAATLELINKGLEAVAASGKLAEIKAKWGLK